VATAPGDLQVQGHFGELHSGLLARLLLHGESRARLQDVGSHVRPDVPSNEHKRGQNHELEILKKKKKTKKTINVFFTLKNFEKSCINSIFQRDI
jgi:hypothetical protein